MLNSSVIQWQHIYQTESQTKLNFSLHFLIKNEYFSLILYFEFIRIFLPKIHVVYSFIKLQQVNFDTRARSEYNSVNAFLSIMI